VFPTSLILTKHYKNPKFLQNVINIFYYITRISLALFFLFNIHTAFSQQKDSSKTTPSIIVKARALKDRILLRWAANQPLAWKQANGYGYMIERYTVLRNGASLPQAEKKLLTPAPLKPLPIVAWEPLLETNDDAALIAQGIYGESFAVEAGEEGIAKIVNQATELEQRFAFSLMAADRNFEAAKMAGWAWVDSTVLPNEKYLYSVYAAVPAGKTAIDTGGVFISTADYEPLPKPMDMHAVFGDKAVMLSWNYKLMKDYYTSYFIERSSDGKNFQRLSDQPVVNMNENEKNTPSRIFYSDSLADNNNKYYYRVRGISSFGEIGPPSDVAAGTGKKLLAYVPHITRSDIAPDGKQVSLNWEIDDEAKPLLSHFELSRASNDKGPYTTVLEKIAADKRSINFKDLLSTNYFVITAVDKYGSRRESFSELVQPVDSFPPAIPTGLKAVIDTAGKVTLSWNANTEADLQGYIVLKSNLKNEEMSVLQSEPFKATGFVDTVNLKSLNSKVYYAVMALDKRFNQSKPCIAIEVKKPDNIPPVSPVFNNYRSDSGKIFLAWVCSPSEDVAKHFLYRKEGKETDNNPWQMLKTFDGRNTNSFADEQTTPDQFYTYRIEAADESGNLSQSSPVLTVQGINTMQAAGVKNLTAIPNRNKQSVEISWRYTGETVNEYQIYRAAGQNGFTLWKTLSGDTTELSDSDAQVNNQYRYGIRATLTSGRMTVWKEVKVEY
jgi:hypothetical protein